MSAPSPTRTFSPTALRQAREKLGWTRHDLSLASGFSYPQLGQWENGYHVPTLVNISRLAGTLGVLVDELLVEVDGES